MNRRFFLTAAAGLLVPEPPVVRRVYSFLWSNPLAQDDIEQVAREASQARVDVDQWRQARPVGFRFTSEAFIESMKLLYAAEEEVTQLLCPGSLFRSG